MQDIAAMLNPLLVALIAIVLYIVLSIRVLERSERGIVSRLGRVVRHSNGPGWMVVFAPFERLVRLSLRIESLGAPAGNSARKGDLAVVVDTVIFFRAIDLGRKVATRDYAELCFAQDAARRGLSELRCPPTMIGEQSHLQDRQSKRTLRSRWNQRSTHRWRLLRQKLGLRPADEVRSND
jgi:hypothetical protein